MDSREDVASIPVAPLHVLESGCKRNVAGFVIIRYAKSNKQKSGSKKTGVRFAHDMRASRKAVDSTAQGNDRARFCKKGEPPEMEKMGSANQISNHGRCAMVIARSKALKCAPTLIG